MKQFEGVREAMLCFYEMFTAYNVGIFDRLLSQEHESIVIGTGTTLTCLTAIMRQEDGEWRLVQAHFCVDVPDEEAATYRRGAWV